MSPAYDYEEENFLTSLLNDSAGRKEILNLGESTQFKDYDPANDDSSDPYCPPAAFKDLLDVRQLKFRSRSQTASCPVTFIRSMEMSLFYFCLQPSEAGLNSRLS
jgi:hypothetical protein